MESKQIRKKVYGHFESGLHCAEAISKTLLEIFSHEPHPDAIKAASGFGGGIAGSTDELCGAFTGGVIASSCLMGREYPGDNLKDCGSVIKEFKMKFLNEFGSLNCSSILEGFSENGNPLGCVKLTANAAVLLAELINERQETNQKDLPTLYSKPRGRVELGQCPFGAGS